VDKYVPAVLGGEKVGKREMVISQPILIAPLSLPPVCCWGEILKLLDGQGHFPSPLPFSKIEMFWKDCS